MAELWHTVGADLSLSSTGDLALATGADETQQRVLRRLLTYPGSYIWQIDYGAGLQAMIGNPASQRRISAIARSQMLKEQGVGRSPAPTADVVVSRTGVVTATIRYADIDTGTTQVLTLPAS